MAHLEHQIQLESYLQQVDALRRTKGDPSWVYQSHEGLMLANGRWFDVYPTRSRGYIQSCYYNAWSTASRHQKKGWQFCEGYMVLENGFITGHAWVMLPDGTAIDPTPMTGLAIMGIFGAAFTRKFVLERQKRHTPSEKYSLLQGDYLTQYDLLRNGLPDHALVSAGSRSTSSRQTPEAQ